MVDWIAGEAIAVATASVTLSRGRIFEGMRAAIKARSQWLGDLISCSYCTSHWVAMGAVLIHGGFWPEQGAVFNFVASSLCLVGVSMPVQWVVMRTLTSMGAFDTKEIRRLRVALETAREYIQSGGVCG